MRQTTPAAPDGDSGIHGDIVALLEAARRAAARSVNALIERLSADLTARFGRGFSLPAKALRRPLGT